MGNNLGVPGGAGGMGGGAGGGGLDTAHSYVDPDPATFPRNGTPVYVNVYHLMGGGGPLNNINGALMGLGAFHSGVAVYGKEWSFGGNGATPQRSGVFPAPPKMAMPNQLHRTHWVGNLPPNVGATPDALERLAQQLGQSTWLCGSYNLMTHNCNHFAEAFVDELNKFCTRAATAPLVYPGYINRAAKLGSGLVPPQMMAAFEAQAPKAPGDARPPTATTGTTAGQPAAPPPPNTTAPSAAESTAPRPAARAPTPAATGTKPATTPTPAAEPPGATAGQTRYSREELTTMPLRDLRKACEQRRVATRGLIERSEFVDAYIAAC